MNKNRLLNLILPVLTVICIAVIWALASLVVDSEYILPTPALTFKSFIKLLGEKEFYTYFLGTLLRSLIAFVCSFSLAFVLAYLCKKVPKSRGAINTLVSMMRALPTIAIALLLYFWTTSFIAPIIVTSLVVLPTLYTNVYNSLGVVDDGLISMCKIYKVKKSTVFFKVQLPQIAPSMLLAVGSGLSLNIKLMVAAEVLSETANSVGYLLRTSKVYFEISTMIALVCVCVLIGLIIELVFNLLSKKAGKWQ